MKRIKLIVVDDSQQMKKLCAEEFSHSSEIELLEQVSDGSKALDIIRERKPDVVLLDLVLPNRDGMALLEEILALENAPKVIIATALSGDAFVLNAMQMGASYYFIKPCSATDLIGRMRGICAEQAVKTNVDRQEHISSIIEAYQNSTNTNTNPVPVKNVYKNRNLDERISNIFITVGIPAHIKGYQFLREAIKMAIDTPDIVNSITKKLYPSIAQKFGTSASKVERAIRHAIEVAWNRGKIENINSIFGLQVYGTNEKPTNGEFIALVADKMIIEGC